MDDLLVKSGHKCALSKDRILFAPGHKIAQNVFQLMQENECFQVFLPEFSLLHLRKSKITELFSCYKAAGLLHMLKFMRDQEDEKDWMNLITISMIITATKNIRQLAMALHLAFLVKFYRFLPEEDACELLLGLEQSTLDSLGIPWDNQYKKFVEENSKRNASFCLQHEMLGHMDEIVAIDYAERIGGPNGHNLLLSAAIKSSLPFSYLNHASFCTRLLHEHYRAGLFHAHLKQNLYTTRHNNSKSMFALADQREIDHQIALKGFRPGSGLSAVLPRMSIVDHLMDITAARKRSMQCAASDGDQQWSFIESTATANQQLTQDKNIVNHLGKGVTYNDLDHILPTTAMILQMGGLSLDEDDEPKNVYSKESIPLNIAILDRETYDLGCFLIKRHAAELGLFEGLTKRDLPNVKEIAGPKQVITKIAAGKSTTIRRATIKPSQASLPEQEKLETKRKQVVKRKSKHYDAITSEMNACQALVKPDCSKPDTQKAMGMKKAILNLLCRDHDSDQKETSKQKLDRMMARAANEGLIYLEIAELPQTVTKQVKVATVELAGVKFKAKVVSGENYLQFIQSAVVGDALRKFPALSRIILCEEKYSFTPDDFKSLTRAKRAGKDAVDVYHLKESTDMISLQKFSRASVTRTMKGKQEISKFLGNHVEHLNLHANVALPGCFDL